MYVSSHFVPLTHYLYTHTIMFRMLVLDFLKVRRWIVWWVKGLDKIVRIVLKPWFYLVTVELVGRLAYFSCLLTSNTKSCAPQFNQRAQNGLNPGRQYGAWNSFANLIPIIWQSTWNPQYFYTHCYNYFLISWKVFVTFGLVLLLYES